MLNRCFFCFFFFFSSRRRHTRLTCDWSSDVCSSDLAGRPEIDIRLGRSAEVLDQLRAEGAWEGRRALFWLDAHWCESASADPAGQCPLLDELAAIGVVDQA